MLKNDVIVITPKGGYNFFGSMIINDLDKFREQSQTIIVNR